MAEAFGIPGTSQASSSDNEGYSDERFINVVAELWELKINLQEFQQLKPELVQKIYYTFLKDLGVNLEKLNEIPPQLISAIDHGEDSLGAIRLIVLSSNMKKHLKRIFNDDTFKMADVFNPKPKRTKKYFAMIYDFMVFTESYFEEMETKEEEMNALIERRKKLNAQLHKFQQMIIERKAENTRCEVSKEEEMRRLKEKTKELQKCHEEKLFMKGQVDALNLSLAGLTTVTKDTELRIVEAKAEKQRLEGLVIQASEEEEIKKRNDKLALLKEDNQRRKNYLVQLQQKHKSKTSHKDKVDKFISPLHDIEQGKSKEKVLQTNIEQRLSQISELHEKIKYQEEKTLKLTQHLTSAETNFQNKQQIWDLKQKSFEKEIKEQKQVLEDLQRNHTEYDIVHKDMMDNHTDMEEEIKLSKRKINSTKATIQNNYKLILDWVEENNLGLHKPLQDVVETIEEFKNVAK